MKPSVLVVEDDPDLMLTFRVVLQTAGYMVIGVTTGEEALAALEAVEPDVMILDLCLPGIDGWEVLGAVRNDVALPKTPIVLTSANAKNGQRTRANELGCADFLDKPFSAEELWSTVDRVLDCPVSGSPQVSKAVPT